VDPVTDFFVRCTAFLVAFVGAFAFLPLVVIFLHWFVTTSRDLVAYLV
jgi:hypothetical protein